MEHNWRFTKHRRSLIFGTSRQHHLQIDEGRMKKIFFTLLLASLLFSCAKKEEKTGAEISYLKAYKFLKDKNYSQAAEEFEKIDEDFPFSKWAQKAQTMAVYARYKDEDYQKLNATVEDFLRLNPNSEYVPYMIYMKGLSYYNIIPNIERAQDDAQQASYAFRELIARFPNSDYAADASEKLDFIDEHLAGAKMSVGRYEMRNHNFLGALEYFSEVKSRYRQTKQIPEALFRLSEIYYKIGVKDEANKAVQQLEQRFQENYWTQLAKKNQERLEQ
jgi:outer membrane protein assembly factor BamD